MLACPGRPERPLRVAATAVRQALALHARRPRRADPFDLPHRVQRDQPGARRGVALRRHARGLLPRLAARGRRRGAALHAAAYAPAGAWAAATATSPATTACGPCARKPSDDVAGPHGAGAAHAGGARPRRHAADPGQAAAREHARCAARPCAILDIILRDEVGHVAIGNHWYRWLCERDGPRSDRALPGALSPARGRRA